MMNFDEPDLEELIQHDLHSEMNKILDESNTESHNSQKIVESTGAHLPPSPTIKVQDSPAVNKNGSSLLSHHDNLAQHTKSNGISELKITNIHSTNGNMGNMFSCEEHVPHAAVKSELATSDFSGHFSVEQFPTSTVDEHIAMDLIQKSEQSDLSNLAWLTTVDVQQALQRDGSLTLDGEGDGTAASSQQPISVAGDSGFPTTSGGLPSPNFSPQAAGKGPVSTGSVESGLGGYRAQPRFTPIQPHPNHDHTHQRYLLHGGHQGAAHHRTLLPMSDRPGPHRYGHHGAHHSGYHPYHPPPPYGTAGYNHDGYHYNRPQGLNQKIYPKPVYSYSCLIAMSLQKSKTGCLPVSDIYSFMMENFPYFKTAPDGWKNSVRHNLSLNKCFEKVEKPNGTQRKGCLWALNPAKAGKMEEEVQKWKRKDPEAIRRSMSHPDEFDREMEELRRADEEAARRRMLSLSSHGLSMATPPAHAFHPGFPMHRDARPHMHPSGSVSMPTTPQHLSPQAGTYRHPMTPIQRGVSTNVKMYGHAGNHASAHPPRQLFQFPAEPQAMSLGVPEVTSTPVAKATSSFGGPGTPLKPLPQLSSPNSSSSTSSGTCAFFSSLADTLSAAGPDLNDLDLDSSLADLSALQGPFWDDATGADTPHDGASDPLLSGEAYEEADARRSGTQSSGDPMTPSFHVMRQSAHSSGEGDAGDVFPSRFGGDLSYLASTGNNKPVMLH